MNAEFLACSWDYTCGRLQFVHSCAVQIGGDLQNFGVGKGSNAFGKEGRKYSGGGKEVTVRAEIA